MKTGGNAFRKTHGGQSLWEILKACRLWGLNASPWAYNPNIHGPMKAGCGVACHAFSAKTWPCMPVFARPIVTRVLIT